MPDEANPQITNLLEAAHLGEVGASDRLIEVVHDELYGMARRQMAREVPGHTLQATALVNEAFMRLLAKPEAIDEASSGEVVKNSDAAEANESNDESLEAGNGSAQFPNWQNRAHFFGAAAEAMRRILVDHARSRNRKKRGANWTRVHLEGIDVPAEDESEQIIMLHEALKRLDKMDAGLAQLVKLRCFVGLTNAQVAEALNTPPRTVDRAWALAKKWLRVEMDRITYQ